MPHYNGVVEQEFIQDKGWYDERIFCDKTIYVVDFMSW